MKILRIVSYLGTDTGTGGVCAALEIKFYINLGNVVASTCNYTVRADLKDRDVPVEVLLASVVCKTLVPPARKVGLYLQDLLHVLVVRCITRAPHTCPIRHRLISRIDLEI